MATTSGDAGAGGEPRTSLPSVGPIDPADVRGAAARPAADRDAILDPSGLVTRWNAGAQRIMRSWPEEIIGRQFSACSPAADVASRRLAAAEAASRTKSEFLAALSHALRTPVDTTLGRAAPIEIGVDGPGTERQREQIRRNRGSQRHLLQIIGDLLDYSRIEAGRLDHERVPVAVDEVLATVCPMVEPQAAASGRGSDRRSAAISRVVGGDVCVESAHGEGARFTLGLPAP